MSTQYNTLNVYVCMVKPLDSNWESLVKISIDIAVNSGYI